MAVLDAGFIFVDAGAAYRDKKDLTPLFTELWPSLIPL